MSFIELVLNLIFLLIIFIMLIICIFFPFI